MYIARRNIASDSRRKMIGGGEGSFVRCILAQRKVTKADYTSVCHRKARERKKSEEVEGRGKS